MEGSCGQSGPESRETRSAGVQRVWVGVCFSDRMQFREMTSLWVEFKHRNIRLYLGPTPGWAGRQSRGALPDQAQARNLVIKLPGERRRLQGSARTVVPRTFLPFLPLRCPLAPGPASRRCPAVSPDGPFPGLLRGTSGSALRGLRSLSQNGRLSCCQMLRRGTGDKGPRHQVCSCRLFGAEEKSQTRASLLSQASVRVLREN